MRIVSRSFSLLCALALFLPLAAMAQSTATVTAERVNVRATAAIDGSIVGQVSRGATVTVLEKTDTWTKISSGSITGWVRSNLLGAASASSSAAPAKTESAAKTPETKSSSQSAAKSSESRSSNKSSSQAATPGALFDGTSKFIGAHVGASAYGSTASFGGSIEFPYNDRIGIGAWADYWSYGGDSGAGFGNYSWDYKYIALAGTGAYHFPIASNPKLDPFVGLAVGYFIVSYDCSFEGAGGAFDCDAGAKASRIFFGGFGGVRYGFSDNLAGVLRAGFGASYLTIGVDFKM
jgi:hypothetical protein